MGALHWEAAGDGLGNTRGNKIVIQFNPVHSKVRSEVEPPTVNHDFCCGRLRAEFLDQVCDPVAVVVTHRKQRTPGGILPKHGCRQPEIPCDIDITIVTHGNMARRSGGRMENRGSETIGQCRLHCFPVFGQWLGYLPGRLIRSYSAATHQDHCAGKETTQEGKNIHWGHPVCASFTYL